MRRRISWLWVSIVLLTAAFGWLIAPNDPYKTGLHPAAEPPGELLFGADTLGRDLLSRVLYGGASTLVTGLGAAALAWVLGGILGALSANRSPLVSGITMIFNNAFLALPSFFVALIILTGLGASLSSVVIAAGVSQMGIASQVWSGAINTVLREPYVEAASALGATRQGIFYRHVLPNVLPLLIVYGCTLFASSVLIISSLSFLGLGGDISDPTWGNMLAEGRTAIRYAPHVMFVPAAALMLVVSALNTAARLFNRP